MNLRQGLQKGIKKGEKDSNTEDGAHVELWQKVDEMKNGNLLMPFFFLIPSIAEWLYW